MAKPKKECKRCHRVGKWREEYCSKCLEIFKKRELYKSPYKIFGGAKGIVGAKNGI